MNENFKKSLEFVFKWEGGYAYSADDPGGETQYGISKKAYPDLDIKNITRELAADIYYRDYWVPMGCDSANYPLDIVSFDTAVSCGVARTKKWLGSSANTVGLLMKRLEHYTYVIRVNPKMLKFYVGWNKRVLDLYATIVKGGG